MIKYDTPLASLSRPPFNGITIDTLIDGDLSIQSRGDVTLHRVLRNSLAVVKSTHDLTPPIPWEKVSLGLLPTHHHNMIRNFFPTTLHRCFSTTAALYRLVDHRLYPNIDWTKIEAGNYAVVDPVSPDTILYLSEQDYIVMVRVAIVSNRTLKVLAGPNDSPIDTESSSSDPSSETPPTSKTTNPWSEILNFDSFRQHSKGRRGKRRLLNIFNTRLVEFLAPTKASASTVSGVRGIKMVSLTRENVVRWFSSWHEIVSWWSRGSSMTTVQAEEANSFGLWLLKVLRNQGIGHLIARLKIMLFVVNAYLGGRKITSTQNLGFRIRLSNGLPSALPLFVRAGIRAGNRHYIHIWTSMLFSYKGIVGKWQEPNLSTGSIASPHPNLDEVQALKDFKLFGETFWDVLFVLLNLKRPDFKIKNYFFSTHAGPNASMTILGAGLDAYLWSSLDLLSKMPYALMTPSLQMRLGIIRNILGVKSNYIREWLEVTGQPEILLSFRKTAKMFAINQKMAQAVISHNKSILFSIISRFPNLSKSVKQLINKLIGKDGTTNMTALVPLIFSTKEERMGYEYIFDFLGLNLKTLRWREPTLQRLHNLYEAAGKVRTIAIVDYWTNFVLKPFHDWMFDVLARLPQDATFDQEGKVRQFAQRGYFEIWSYDLKSATDLIPIALYKALFSSVIPANVLDIWIKLLIDRDFKVPSSTLKAFKNHPRTVRYNTGQPMGALTSWASMALVHHALVLFAAVRAGAITPSQILDFQDYMVLGDDIVIAHGGVAEEYRKLMVELHVPLSMSKSHISEHGMFNFANQTFVGELNYSPVSLREEVNAASMSERIELALRLVRRGWKDLNSRVWVPYLMRLLLPQRVWALLTPQIRNGKVPLLIRWILAVLLTPGTTRYGWAGYSNIALETFLGAQLRKGDLFSMSLERMGDLIDRHRSGKVLISILAKWSDKIYAQFLSSRKTLKEDYKNWVRKSISVDLEWLFDSIFEKQVGAAIERWTAKYRLPLKELIISTKLTSFDIYDVEAGTGRPWSELVGFVSEAEAELPVVPDFKSSTLDALCQVEVPGGGGTPDHELKIAIKRDRQARESLLRVTNLLGMIDDLGPSGTPSFVEAGDYTQVKEDAFSSTFTSK